MALWLFTRLIVYSQSLVKFEHLKLKTSQKQWMVWSGCAIPLGVSIIDLDSSTVCSLLSMYAEVDQSFDTTLLLPEINEVLHSDYAVCLVYQITTQPFPLFLEHHLWGDEFVAFVVTPRGIEWKLEIRADSIYRHQGKNQLVRIEGAARFAHLSVFTSLSEGLLVVVTTVGMSLLCHSETEGSLPLRIS